MIEHRIRELRERRNLSQEALGALVQKTKHQISRIELGETKLDLTTARKIAKALDATLAEVVGAEAEDAEPQRGLSEDVSEYTPTPGEPLAMEASNGERYLRTAESDVLDKARIYKGDRLVIDISEARVKAVAPLEIVLVRLHPSGDFMKPVTLLRQFIPPRLLITNSSKGNLPSIDMDEEDAAIVGVVVFTSRRLG